MNLDKYKELRNVISCYFNQDFSFMYNDLDDAIYNIILDWNEEGLILFINQINSIIVETKIEENLEKVLINDFSIEIDPKGFGIISYTNFLKYIQNSVIKYLKEGINDPKYFYKNIKLNLIKKIYTSYFIDNNTSKFKNIDDIVKDIINKFSIDEIYSIGGEIDLLQRMTKTEEELENFLKTEFQNKIDPKKWGANFNSQIDILIYIFNKTNEYIKNYQITRLSSQ